MTCAYNLSTQDTELRGSVAGSQMWLHSKNFSIRCLCKLNFHKKK